LLLGQASVDTQRAEPGGEHVRLLAEPAVFTSGAPGWHDQDGSDKFCPVKIYY